MPSVRERIVNKIHAPMLVRAGGCLRLAAQQRDALAAFDLHAQLQPLLAVQPIHPFLPHLPAFALEHHQHPQVAEPGTAHGDIANALA